MNDATAAAASTEARDGPTSLRALVSRIAHAVNEILPAGDVASLRRLSPTDLGSPAFWRIVMQYLEPGRALPGSGYVRDVAEKRWATILNVIAQIGALHRAGPRLGLGHALARAGFSELRLARLLRAGDDTLLDEARLVARFLAAKGQPVDVSDIARLVLSDGRRDAETVRRRIARDYYAVVATGKEK